MKICRFRSISGFTLVLIAAVMGSSLFGCARQPSGPDASSSAAKITVVDDAGSTITFAKPVDRIVSLSPANTEIVYALGVDEALVGVTTFCDYPEAAAEKEKIGDFANPNVERIIALSPDIVLATGGIQERVVSDLKSNGIEVMVVDPTDFDTLIDDIEKIGLIAGAEDEAASLAKSIQESLDSIRERAASTDRLTVFVEIYSQPLMTAGSGTFIDAMIDAAGGTNVGRGAGSGFPQYSLEQLTADDPDVYIALRASLSDVADLSRRPGFDALTAVRLGRVVIVDDDVVSRPGPRLVEGLELIAKAIHPEVFGAQP